MSQLVIVAVSLGLLSFFTLRAMGESIQSVRLCLGEEHADDDPDEVNLYFRVCSDFVCSFSCGSRHKMYKIHQNSRKCFYPKVPAFLVRGVLLSQEVGKKIMSSFPFTLILDMSHVPPPIRFFPFDGNLMGICKQQDRSGMVGLLWALDWATCSLTSYAYSTFTRRIGKQASGSRLLEGNIYPLKIVAPWKRRFRTWKPSF